MQAILLVGGKGTRLSALHPNVPKALAPVAGQPFLQWQADWLRRGGVIDIHLAAGHLAEVLEAWVRARPATDGLRYTLSREPGPLGTGGGLKFVEPFIRSDPFLVLNGDSLLPNLDFASLIQAHRQAGALATIAVTRIEEAGRYGTVEFDASGVVTAFREKASRTEGWINGGVYVLSRAALDLIDPEMPVSIETDVFPMLVARRAVRAQPSPPPLLDMGTPEGIEAMSAFLAKPGTAIQKTKGVD